jgi:hypothetical protein
MLYPLSYRRSVYQHTGGVQRSPKLRVDVPIQTLASQSDSDSAAECNGSALDGEVSLDLLVTKVGERVPERSCGARPEGNEGGARGALGPVQAAEADVPSCLWSMVAKGTAMEPIVLFGIQFTMSLVAYALIAGWYVWSRLSPLPRELALVPLLWVHVFRIVGGTILAPGSVGPGVPTEFRNMIGYGDLVTALLALLALIALRARLPRAIAVVWLCVAVGMIDTVNAIVQSVRFSVYTYALGVNWVIVTLYVPALLVSSYMIFVVLLRHEARTTGMLQHGARTRLADERPSE